ncbi:hypothetical protein K503DRAFT_19505 [Rhizopogon vinicolor AM-OR11-026]|uniref:Protein kinase domain-containing protein n=1 Tax=Rhizopogon vinicolor AM-OR11-026 TaxID=1314800 RepID=A0A1B7N5T5_9AGAM|nr:hypothetical protein K503DRAFT_19505 [Rhizopogon vinicolor AM-OR11-026]
MYFEVVNITRASWTSSFHGNFRWLAPELLGKSGNELPVCASKLSDIYSFGGIMLQVLTSKVPYYHISEPLVILCNHTGEKPDRSRYPAFSDKY